MKTGMFTPAESIDVPPEMAAQLKALFAWHEAERLSELERLSENVRRTNTITLGKDVTPEEAYMNGLDIPYPSLEEIRGTELEMLWDSTAAFHERFDTIHDEEHPFIPAQYRAFMEEVAEFSIEVLGSQEFGGDVEAIERELTDVIVVGMGLLIAHGRSLADLRAAMRHVAEGNDAKTTDKYAKNAKGKIAKKTA